MPLRFIHKALKTEHHKIAVEKPIMNNRPMPHLILLIITGTKAK